MLFRRYQLHTKAMMAKSKPSRAPREEGSTTGSPSRGARLKFAPELAAEGQPSDAWVGGRGFSSSVKRMGSLPRRFARRRWAVNERDSQESKSGGNAEDR